MKTYEDIIKALEVISAKIANGEVCDAVALWRETMHDEGRCSNGCPFDVSPDSVTCAHCLAGKLSAMTLSVASDHPKADAYADMARLVMDWIDFTRRSP